MVTRASAICKDLVGTDVPLKKQNLKRCCSAETSTFRWGGEESGTQYKPQLLHLRFLFLLPCEPATSAASGCKNLCFMPSGDVRLAKA